MWGFGCDGGEGKCVPEVLIKAENGNDGPTKLEGRTKKTGFFTKRRILELWVIGGEGSADSNKESHMLT